MSTQKQNVIPAPYKISNPPASMLCTAIRNKRYPHINRIPNRNDLKKTRSPKGISVYVLKSASYRRLKMAIFRLLYQ
jgi:hypothetical protein